MTIDEMIAVLQAAKAGKVIELSSVRNPIDLGWYEAVKPEWDFTMFRYRVKPEPPREWTVWVDPDGVISEFGNHLGKGCATRIKVREVLE